MEKLNTHAKLKEQIAARKKRKFEAVHRLYLQKRDPKSEEDHLRALLSKRRDVVFEICTRSYEEERRKAEDELTKVSVTFLVLINNQIMLTFCRRRKRY